jgi:hypothetical protein
MKGRIPHLSEEEILRSLVDEDDLTHEAKGHLGECAVCQEKRAKLSTELGRLGDMARQWSPSPQDKAVLPLPETRPFSARFPVYAAGLAAVVLIVSLYTVPLLMERLRRAQSDQAPTNGFSLYLLEDILDEPAMSREYLDMTTSSDTYLDEEFMEFVAPLAEPSDTRQGSSSPSLKA